MFICVHLFIILNDHFFGFLIQNYIHFAIIVISYYETFMSHVALLFHISNTYESRFTHGVKLCLEI
jgi:hypothetical protein